MASSSIKRQRKRKRIDTDGDPEFQVAPMVDVLLVLMLFFMAITSTEVLKKDKNLTLADAKNAKKDEHPQRDQIVVNVAWNASDNTPGYSMDGIGYPTADALKSIIAGRCQQNPASYVVIRADRDVQFTSLSDLMNACASAGIATVTFAVITGGSTDKKPAPAGSGDAASK